MLLIFQTDCLDDADCAEIGGDYYQCNQKDFLCQYKGLSFDLKSTIIGCCLVLIGSFLANASGVGGGPLFVPTYLYLFHMTMMEAVALSPPTIISGIVIK